MRRAFSGSAQDQAHGSANDPRAQRRWRCLPAGFKDPSDFRDALSTSSMYSSTCIEAIPSNSPSEKTGLFEAFADIVELAVVCRRSDLLIAWIQPNDTPIGSH